MAQSSSPLIRVVIATANAGHGNAIRVLLQADKRIVVAGTATSPADLLGLEAQDPDIVLLSPQLSPEDVTRVIRQVVQLAPRAQVLLVSDGDAPVDLQRVVLAGARGVLPLPLGADTLLNTIHELMYVETSRRQRMQAQAQERHVRAHQGRVTVVFSPKGGVGCTLLACNLGIALQWATMKPTALVDMSVQFGTVGTALNLHSLHTLAELLPHFDALDSTILNDVLVKHDSGMRVLLPPAHPEDLDLVSTEALVGVVGALRQHYNQVVVDLWHSVEDATLGVLEVADHVLLVTTPEVPSLYTVRRFLEMLRGYPGLREKIWLVVNRLPSRGAIGLPEIQQSLGLQARATIPSDGYLMTTAVNEGVPMVQRNANSAFARSLSQLAAELAGGTQAGDEPAESPRGRRFQLNRRR